jgi:hypothetical protein
MTERRYNEDEVAEIFERATEAEQGGRRQLPAAEGMTLAQLQEIGREVGMAPELVAQAADELDRPALRVAKRRFVGFPLRVGKTVELGRRISDEEWERLVADLRETFDAFGRVREDGSFRQWSNGNLRAVLEPTATGHRLRVATTNGAARAWMSGGLGLLGIGAATWVVAMLGVADPGAFRAVALLSLMGGGMFGIGALRLPGWARRRLLQMEGIAQRLLAAATPSDEAAASDEGPSNHEERNT